MGSSSTVCPREKRERIKSGKGNKAETDHYYEHNRAFNAWRRLTGKGRKNGPVAPKPDPSLYTPTEVKQFHEKYKAFFKKYPATEEGKAAKARLMQGQGTPDEVAEFNNLHHGWKEYLRWKRWKNAQSAEDYSPEEQKALDANREGYLIWRREYIGPERKDLRDRLEAGQGPPEEITRYRTAKTQHGDYRKVMANHGNVKSPIKLHADDRAAVERLEELRMPRESFKKEFGRARKAEWDALEAGGGDPDKVTRFREGLDATREYGRLWYRVKTRLKKLVEEYDQDELGDEDDYDDDDDDDDPNGSGIVVLGPRDSGRPRWHTRLLEILEEQESRSRKDPSRPDEPLKFTVTSSEDPQTESARGTTRLVSSVSNAAGRLTHALADAYRRATNVRPPGGFTPLRAAAQASL